MSNAEAPFVDPFIVIRHNSAYVKVYISTIVYLKADGNQTFFYVTEPTSKDGLRHYSTGYNLGHYTNKMGTNFFRIHAAFHLNLEFFKTLHVDHTVELTDSKLQRLPVSRRPYSKLLKLLKGR